MANEPILIVDDNPVNMKLASFLLSKRGYQVKTALSAAVALETLRTFLPRLVLLDLQMPDMDGFELARRLKADARTRHIVLVAVSAYAMKGDEARALAAGCNGYIAKPIDTRSFAGAIEHYLATGTE